VDEPLPLGGDLCLRHARVDDELAVLHRGGRDVVGESHAYDLLLRLERASGGEKRRRVGDVAEGGEPLTGEGRRLADHAIRGLGPERELEPHALVWARRLARQLEHPRCRRPRVALVIALEEANLGCPRSPCGVVLRGFEADENGLALAREDTGVVPLHAPEVGEVEDVVGCTDDQRVESVLVHQRAYALQLRVVTRPAHLRSR
jgi:hypothetical protein